MIHNSRSKVSSSNVHCRQPLARGLGALGARLAGARRQEHPLPRAARLPNLTPSHCFVAADPGRASLQALVFLRIVVATACFSSCFRAGHRAGGRRPLMPRSDRAAFRPRSLAVHAYPLGKGVSRQAQGSWRRRGKLAPNAGPKHNAHQVHRPSHRPPSRQQYRCHALRSRNVSRWAASRPRLGRAARRTPLPADGPLPHAPGMVGVAPGSAV